MEVDTLLSQLRQNIIVHDGLRYLLAGQYQFRTIWIRDICFAFLALLECPRSIHREFEDIMFNTVDLFAKQMNPETGLGPKCLDTRNSEWRCISESIRHAILTRVLHIPRSNGADDPDRPFHGMFIDGRYSTAIDSNLLIYLVASKLGILARDPAFGKTLLHWYDDKRHITPSGAPGVILQEAYSDWQDSRDRSPATFHINLLFWRALRETPGREQEAEWLRREMIRVFSGDSPTGGRLYHAMPHPGVHICLEDQLLALHWGFHSTNEFILFEALQKHPLWISKPLPGFPTSPDYDTSPHWQVKLAGLHHYHDSLHWSWLLGLSGLVAHEQGDYNKAASIYRALDHAAKKEGGISEIYDMDAKTGQLKQVDRFSYQAEMPWTWGVAYALRFAIQYRSS